MYVSHIRMTAFTGKTRRKRRWNHLKENWRNVTPSFSKCFARGAAKWIANMRKVCFTVYRTA